MSTGFGNGYVRKRGRHVAGRRKKPPTAWREQRLVVLLALLGAALALVIGIFATQSNAKPARARSAGTAHDVAKGATANRGSGVRSSTTNRPRPGETPVAAVARACAPSDVTITTTTDRPHYARGDQVTVMTKLVSESSCVLKLEASGEFGCGESIVIDTSARHQVFPAPGQSEQCGALPHGMVQPGTTDVETVVWDLRGALSSGRAGKVTPGRYEAVGNWYWRSGKLTPPYEVAAHSTPFEVLP
ncbi:MAG: hypothetical protein ACRDV4_00645 [Acidimicrobiales bacterium]